MNYLYQITNLINNKIYVGVHKTNNIDDGYMGSGKVIVSAIKKYGIENFRKDILEFFDTYDLVLQKETEIVTEEFLQRPDVYNLRKGGSGGFDYINKTGLASVGRVKGYNNRTKESYAKMSEGGKKGAASLNISGNRTPGNASRADYARLHTQTKDAKIKRKKTLAEINHQQGTKNSQFGKCWITDGIESKKIKKEELEKYVSEGWRQGRIMHRSTSGEVTSLSRWVEGFETPTVYQL